MAVALLMASTGVVAGVGAAQARSYTRSDPRGDVFRISEENEIVPAPDQVVGDIVRTAFRHKKHRVRIRIQFADLRRTFDAMFATAAIETNEGLHREAHPIVLRKDPGKAGSWKGVAFLTDERVNQVRCSLHHTFDYTHNALIIGIPRRCLSNPRWIRVSVYVLTYRPQPSRPQFYRWVDNALRGTADPAQPPPFSPPIYRG